MKIMAAVDGSLPAQRAVEVWGRWFGRGGHAVTVLNVTPPVTPSASKKDVSLTEALRDSARLMTADYARRLKTAGVRSARGMVLESIDVAGAVLDEARREKARLVVVGARGLSTFKAFLLGSVSQRVLDHSTQAVMVARGRGRSGAFKAVAALDEGPAGLRALRFLTALGLPAGSEVTLLHVVDAPLAGWMPEVTGVYGGGYGAMVGVPPGPRGDLEKRGRRVLEKGARLFGKGIKVKTRLAWGPTAPRILRESGGKDLVVMGRRGRSVLDRFLLGSVSHTVALHSPASVLVAP
jgi:nucleotide-binding universal stress UspA family protein